MIFLSVIHSFYSSYKYKQLQSRIAKKNWREGKYASLIGASEKRQCKNKDCHNTIEVKKYDPKLFCSISCAAHTNNLGKNFSLITRKKISKSISALPKSFFQKPIKSRIKLICNCCHKEFKVVPYLAKKRKYCCNACAIKTIGSMTTSPKASKGKSGIRKDIDPTICFYSTWEANITRVFNLVGIKWVYAPKIFFLGKHSYRPDFFLPEYNIYIEVKNYLGGYSLERDKLFRKKYPSIKLELILKESYNEIKSNYKNLVENWEY